MRTPNRTENENELYAELDKLEQRVTTLEAETLLLKNQLTEILEAMHDAQTQ